MLSELMRNIVKIYVMYFCTNNTSNRLNADPSGRAVYSVGLRPLACWDRGFEASRWHGYLCLVTIVCCQVEVSASS